MSVTIFTNQEQEALSDNWTWARFLFGPCGTLGVWALWNQWPAGVVGWQIFWTAFTAYSMFCWTSCLHETGHQTLTPHRETSIWLGRVIGTLIFVPYTVYRESHIRHHAYLNKPHDWELWPYSDPKASIWFRRGFALFDFALGIFGSMVTFGRLFFHKDSPLTDKKLRRTVWMEYAFCVLFWGSLFAVFTNTGTWGLFLRAWAIPHLVAGMVQTGRKFTEHIGLASYDPMLGTRTVVGNNWFTRVCTWLNFDIFVHGPHHRHPRVAHRTLKVKMNEYLEKQPELQYPMFRTYSAAVWDMLPYLVKNPGVGMNVGAQAPDAEKKAADNFVADVVEEVLSEKDRGRVPVVAG